MNRMLATFAVVVAPLPVVGILAWANANTLPEAANIRLVLLGGISAILLLFAGLDWAHPSLFMRRANSLGRTLAAVSSGLYFAGAYLQHVPLEWIGILGIYLGLVVYLGGTAFVLPTLLALLVLGLTILPGYASIIHLEFLTQPSLLALIGVTGAIIFFQLRRKNLSKDCELCSSYRSGRETFCLSCGRKVNPIVVVIERKSYSYLVLFAVILLILSQVPVSLLVHNPLTSVALSYAPGGGGNIASYLPSVASALALIGLAAGVRMLGYRRSVLFDNSLGLTPDQFSVLAKIARTRSTMRGSALFERYGKRAGFQDWSSFERLLLRFKSLGLLESRVKVRKGSPELVWKSRFTI